MAEQHLDLRGLICADRAERIRAALGAEDKIYRYGGAEFVICLPGAFQQLLGRRQVRQPDVVEVPRGELGLRHPARRAPDRADAQPLAGCARSAESNHPYPHDVQPPLVRAPRSPQVVSTVSHILRRTRQARMARA